MKLRLFPWPKGRIKVGTFLSEAEIVERIHQQVGPHYNTDKPYDPAIWPFMGTAKLQELNFWGNPKWKGRSQEGGLPGLKGFGFKGELNQLEDDRVLSLQVKPMGQFMNAPMILMALSVVPFIAALYALPEEGLALFFLVLAGAMLGLGYFGVVARFWRLSQRVESHFIDLLEGWEVK